MNAEQFTKERVIQFIPISISENDYFKNEMITIENLIVHKLKEFAKIKCREQRTICGKQDYALKNRMENSPTPEL